MPASFPMDDFRAFGKASAPLFPKALSDDDLNDPLERRKHSDWAWQAVRYRFRICAECNDEFKALLINPSEMWQAGWGDEELTYKLERCIYTFFMSGLSMFESFAYCLYFVGHTQHPGKFPDVAKPRNITLKGTTKAFAAEFPNAPITVILTAIAAGAKFSNIDWVRNVLAHRLIGRRSIRSWTDRTKETWHIPGSPTSLTFDDDMLQRQLDD
ncbi:MAG TPA: hypothetical protein VKS01_06410, partial [Bryobacteraceae bacterium]|nr:hypothetical protein [Bryobacteraceae bacterium]